MKLYLHIGARKTGTSMLQTMFARNAAAFAAQGLFYPLTERARQRAVKGETSSGNGAVLAPMLRPDVLMQRGTQHLQDRVEQRFLGLMKATSCKKMLISSESFSSANEKSLARLEEFLEKIGVDLEVIFFVRNPLDHAFSEWTQKTKGGKDCGGWRAFLRGYVMPFDVTLRRYQARFGDAVHVLNYDHFRRDLLKPVCDILGVRPRVSSEGVIVNRSPGKAELELMHHASRLLADTSVPADTRRKIYRAIQAVMRPIGGRMRAVVSAGDLEVLASNNRAALTYVNQHISGAPLTLHLDGVQTGDLILKPPHAAVRTLMAAMLMPARIRARRSSAKRAASHSGRA
jgi:hypothetical protein